MKRREFVAASCLAGLAPLAAVARGAGPSNPQGKQYYELRLFHLEAGPKEKLFEDFLCKAAIPALNRLGIEPVGAFRKLEGDEANVYVLLPHKSPESFLTMVDKLGEDSAFVDAGEEFLDAPFTDPAYQRYESSLMVAFDGHPRLTVPSKKESRILQLRIYESHNTLKAKKKIEMFNEGGEIEIFNRTGLNIVFFGESIIGPKLPNLTYMLGFDDEDAMKASWDSFIAHPDWDALKKDPQYKDTVSNITNIVLRPLACSQI